MSARARTTQAGTTVQHALQQRGVAPTQLTGAVAGPAQAAGRELVSTTRQTAAQLANDTAPAQRELARTGRRMRRTLAQTGTSYARTGHTATEAVAGRIQTQATRAQRADRRRRTAAALRRWRRPLIGTAAVLLIGAVAVGIARTRRAADHHWTSSLEFDMDGETGEPIPRQPDITDDESP